jgi:hypothetical protein
VTQSIFYQILEYIFAPIGLMVFTFYVKGGKKAEPKQFKLTNDAIERLFIACYSHITYFFSLTAHSKLETLTLYNNQVSTLLCAVIGLLTIFIFKYQHVKYTGKELQRITRHINLTALLLMSFLVCIIFNNNMHHEGYHWTFTIQDFKDRNVEFAYFLLNTRNLVFIPFIVTIVYLVWTNRATFFTSSVKPFIEITNIQSPTARIAELTKIAEDEEVNIEIRIDSHFKIAKQHRDLLNFKDCLVALESWEKLTTSENYPEHQLFPARKLKIEVLCLLDLKDKAYIEVDAVKKKKVLADERNAQFYDLWILTLEEVIQTHG